MELTLYTSFINFNPRSLTGATMRLVYSNISSHYFNPRSLTGATYFMSNYFGDILFQSTLPHGSDDISKLTGAKLLKFQSTLPHGSDVNKHIYVYIDRISIHASSRERLFLLNIFDSDNDFNPRSLTGATCIQ